ncbi:hypothetical protein [Microbacterium luteum]|uniref:hypothetical protein n=1 Tax=Microbacterium luteum TaxID=2782167 RepID=UPI00188820A7|nr:hypothetical protein [Microbacterium luteum]
MTVINLTALQRLLGAPGPVKSGHVEAMYWAGDRPYTKVDGQTITFPAPVSLPIVDGAPSSPIDLEPSGEDCCVRWTIRGGNYQLPVRFTSIPDEGPVDFDDLPIVDPTLFAPVELTPTLQQSIESIARSTSLDRF